MNTAGFANVKHGAHDKHSMRGIIKRMERRKKVMAMLGTI